MTPDPTPPTIGDDPTATRLLAALSAAERRAEQAEMLLKLMEENRDEALSMATAAESAATRDRERLARVRQLSAVLRRDHGDEGETYADAIDLALGGELESLAAALAAPASSKGGGER